MTAEISVSVEEAAQRLGSTRTAVYELIARGTLRSFKIGKRRLIAVTELERFVERQTSVQNMAPVGPKRRVAS
jgi:excisionase family DNA binding protein